MRRSAPLASFAAHLVALLSVPVTSVLAADLAVPTAFPNAFAAQQQRAAKAADGYASALFDSSSAEYMAAFRGALNTASVMARPPPGTASISVASFMTLFDRDPRYVSNAKLLVLNNGTAASERVWNGLPTTGYQNTVVITGSSGLCTGTAISRNAILTAQHCHCDGVNQFVGIGSHYDDQHPGIPVSKAFP